MRKLLSIPFLMLSGILFVCVGVTGALLYASLWLADKVEG